MTIKQLYKVETATSNANGLSVFLVPVVEPQDSSPANSVGGVAPGMQTLTVPINDPNVSLDNFKYGKYLQLTLEEVAAPGAEVKNTTPIS